MPLSEIEPLRLANNSFKMFCVRRTVSTQDMAIEEVTSYPPNRCCRGRLGVKAGAHCPCQLVRFKRYGEEINTVFERKIFPGDVSSVTAGIDELQLGILSQKPYGQLLATHPVGHHHVREQQADFFAILLPHAQRPAS